jgi:hypothetical protein
MKTNYSDFLSFIEVTRKAFYYKVSGLGANYNAVRLDLSFLSLLEAGVIKAAFSDKSDYIIIIEHDYVITFLVRSIAKIDEENMDQTSCTREAIKDLTINEVYIKVYEEICEILE